jgi:uncharacterized phage protein gp47/JayE
MPFNRPTLTALRNLIAADISAAVQGSDALLRFSNLGITGDALARLTNGVYGYLDWIAKQGVPFTATAEYLEAWAGLKGVVRRAATPAIGNVVVTGTPGAILPAGSEFARGDGAVFTLNADATVALSGTATGTATAEIPGAAGNMPMGTALTLGAAVTGIQSNGVAGSAFTGGADVEDDDSLRSRMLQQYAAPPQGGDQVDYVEWALQVPGVTRAWSLPMGFGAGTVVVYFMMDETEAAFGGFPQGTDGAAAAEPRSAPATGDQLAVANHIYPLQPVTALVLIVAPAPNPVAFTISGISGVSAATKAAIAAAIDDVFVREGGPGGAFDGTGTEQGTVDLSLINSAIAAIAGTQPFVITSPTTNITSPTGQIPTRGTITYT